MADAPPPPYQTQPAQTYQPAYPNQPLPGQPQPYYTQPPPPQQTTMMSQQNTVVVMNQQPAEPKVIVVEEEIVNPCEMDCTDNCPGNACGQCCASAWSCDRNHNWYSFGGKGVCWILIIILLYIILGSIAVCLFVVAVVIGVYCVYYTD